MSKKNQTKEQPPRVAVTVNVPRCPRCKTPTIHIGGGSHVRNGRRYRYGHCTTCGQAVVVISQ